MCAQRLKKNGFPIKDFGNDSHGKDFLQKDDKIGERRKS